MSPCLGRSGNHFLSLFQVFSVFRAEPQVTAPLEEATTSYVEALNEVTLPYLTWPDLSQDKSCTTCSKKCTSFRNDDSNPVTKIDWVSGVVHWVKQSSGIFDHVRYSHALPTKVAGFSLVGTKRHCFEFDFFLSVCKV